MSWAVPALKVIAPAVVGSVVSSELNQPSGAERATMASQNRAAEAQAKDIEANTRRKAELERLIGTLEPLSGEAINELIRLEPGKSPDFSGVRGTGDIQLLMQLAGLGAPSGALNQAAAAAQQSSMLGQMQTGDTVESLVALLLGLGQGGGQVSPLGQATLSGGYTPLINV